jgi:hypothetical protein
MDILYEQQMIQAIFKIDEWKIKEWYKEILVVDSNTLDNIYGVRKKFKVFGNIDDSLEFGQCLFFTVSYLQDLHRNKKLFHGDIKPMNIFYEVGNSYITSDSGSLVPLYDEQEWFRPKVFTPGYASISFERKCKAGKKFTRNELLEEDFHQLKISVKEILEKNPKFLTCSIVTHITAVMESCATIE